MHFDDRGRPPRVSSGSGRSSDCHEPHALAWASRIVSSSSRAAAPPRGRSPRTSASRPADRSHSRITESATGSTSAASMTSRGGDPTGSSPGARFPPSARQPRRGRSRDPQRHGTERRLPCEPLLLDDHLVARLAIHDSIDGESACRVARGRPRRSRGRDEHWNGWCESPGRQPTNADQPVGTIRGEQAVRVRIVGPRPRVWPLDAHAPLVQRIGAHATVPVRPPRAAPAARSSPPRPSSSRSATPASRSGAKIPPSFGPAGVIAPGQFSRTAASPAPPPTMAPSSAFATPTASGSPSAATATATSASAHTRNPGHALHELQRPLGLGA